MRAKDMMDYPLLRDELFAITSGRRPVYLRELRKPTDKRPCPDMPDDKDEYVGSKRYLARLTDVVELDQQGLYGFGELVFETTELPFAESVLTTSTIDRHGLSYGDGWSYGMGLLYDDESHKYTHTGTSFKIYNAGNVPVHPFEQDLKITIDNVQGSNDYLQLENTTNGSTFRVTEGVGSNQTIVLDGANITSNGTQYLRKTNRQFIELDPGWNEFKITGASSARVAFDHPFYYL